MGATYDLAVVHSLLRERQYRVTKSAAVAARAIGLDAIDMLDCIRALTAEDFYKTMPSHAIPGLWQDVYRPAYGGRALYVELQIARKQSSDDVLLIVSFKER